MSLITKTKTLISPLYYSHARSIASTPYLQSIGFGWIDKIKGVFTGNKDSSSTSTEFSLIDFVNQMEKAKQFGMMKRSSDPSVSEAFKKQSAILSFLGAIDPSGENLKPNHKQDAIKQCKCTIAEVENALAKYKWAKEAQKKIDKLKEEGKPLPKSFAEVQKLMGTTPLDGARSNLANSGKLGRNAPCPCGSGKKYKRCCGPP